MSQPYSSVPDSSAQPERRGKYTLIEVTELTSLRAQIASARMALEGAEEWLSGWASAEPYISKIRAALKEISK